MPISHVGQEQNLIRLIGIDGKPVGTGDQHFDLMTIRRCKEAR